MNFRGRKTIGCVVYRVNYKWQAKIKIVIIIVFYYYRCREFKLISVCFFVYLFIYTFSLKNFFFFFCWLLILSGQQRVIKWRGFSRFLFCLHSLLKYINECGWKKKIWRTSLLPFFFILGFCFLFHANCHRSFIVLIFYPADYSNKSSFFFH